jgi:hypothetical protein
LKNGRIPPPIPTLGSSETVDESFQEKDGLDAYTAFDKYPTIIRRIDGQWVELRCPKCNGNCIDDYYLSGVAAFRQHLENDHDDTVPDDEISPEWVVKRCQFQAFTEHELVGLMDDREDVEAPVKVNIGAFIAREDAADEEENAPAESSTSRRGNNPSQKRHSSQVEGEDLGEYTFKRFRRARESSSLSVCTKEHNNAPTENYRASMDITMEQSTLGDQAINEWSSCCPCALECHECHNSQCSKAKVCMQLDHSQNCPPGTTHALKPLCMMFLLGQACDASTCDFSHDEDCKKAVENHDCYKH